MEVAAGLIADEGHATGLSLCSGAIGPAASHQLATEGREFGELGRIGGGVDRPPRYSSWLKRPLVVPCRAVAGVIRRRPSVNHTRRAGSQGRCGAVTRNASFPVTLVVQKYGGTSVADLDRIRNVAARVKRQVGRASRWRWSCPRWPGSTNQLVGWVHGLDAAGYDTAEYDQVVASGEQVTVGLLAIALQTIGVPARSFLGWQAGFVTDVAYGKARILDVDPEPVRACLAAGKRRGRRRLPGHGAGAAGHDARPRRFGHLGGGAGGRAAGRSLRHLHGRRRRLHHRSAHRRQGAQARPHHLRGDAGDGIARGQGPADALGGARHAASGPGAGAVELRGPARHAGGR